MLSFFLGKRNLNFKHLIASWVDVGVNSPWGKSGSYPTKTCIIDGIMDTDLFRNTLESTFAPFIRDKLPDLWFVQDNDLKHTLRQAQVFFEENNIN